LGPKAGPPKYRYRIAAEQPTAVWVVTDSHRAVDGAQDPARCFRVENFARLAVPPGIDIGEVFCSQQLRRVVHEPVIFRVAAAMHILRHHPLDVITRGLGHLLLPAAEQEHRTKGIKTTHLGDGKSAGTLSAKGGRHNLFDARGGLRRIGISGEQRVRAEGRRHSGRHVRHDDLASLSQFVGVAHDRSPGALMASTSTRISGTATHD
jgi:hypothetical protein